MKHDKLSRRPGDGTLSRRQMLRALASISLGVSAGPLLSSLAIAGEIGHENATRMVAAIIFESFGPAALRRALRYAGEAGFVASMPALLHARANAPYDNIIWNTWFTANSEESVVTTGRGNHLVVTVHGGGIFALPGRFERSLRADFDRSNTAGLTGQYAARISEIEASDLLKGQLPDGSEIPIYPFEEFKRGVADLPRRYAVVLDFKIAKKSPSDYQSFEVLIDDPIMIVRAGGVVPLVAYLDKAKARHNTKAMGNWHPYNRINPDQPQTRILELSGNKGGWGTEGDDLGLGWGYDADYGITGGGAMTDMARYVAIAPRNVSASLQHLDFEL